MEESHEIFEVLREKTMKSIKIFFEASVKAQFQECLDGLYQIITQIPEDESSTKFISYNNKLQEIMKKLKFGMQESYKQQLNQFKVIIQKIFADMELELNKIEDLSNKWLINNNINYKQYWIKKKSIIILIEYDLEFGQLYNQVFGPSSISQLIKPSDVYRNSKPNPLKIAKQMVIFLLSDMNQANIFYYQYINKQCEMLRSMDEMQLPTQTLINFSQSKAASIIWLSKNKDDKTYFERLKKIFSKEELIFLESRNVFFRRIREHCHVHLIIPGSLCQELITYLIKLTQIHSITIFCNNCNLHKELVMQHSLIRCITNRFNQVLNSVGLHIKSLKFFQTCSLRDLKASFNQNDPLYYIKKEYSQSFLGKLNRAQILQIIRETIGHLSPEIQATSCSFLVANQEKLSEAIAGNFSSSDDLIHLFTQEKAQFFNTMNRLLSTLNESAIIAFSPIITSLRSSIINYDDDQSIFNFPKLYRGIDCSVESFLKSYSINDIIVFPGFTSTSSDLNVALQFANSKIILEISYQNALDSKIYNQLYLESYPEVSNVFSVVCEQMRAKNIQIFSSFRAEKEFLFPCFSAFKILNCSTKCGCTYIEIEFLSVQDDKELTAYLQNDKETLFEFIKDKEKQSQQSQQSEQNNQIVSFYFQGGDDNGNFAPAPAMQVQQNNESDELYERQFLLKG